MHALVSAVLVIATAALLALWGIGLIDPQRLVGLSRAERLEADHVRISAAIEVHRRIHGAPPAEAGWQAALTPFLDGGFPAAPSGASWIYRRSGEMAAACLDFPGATGAEAAAAARMGCGLLPEALRPAVFVFAPLLDQPPSTPVTSAAVVPAGLVAPAAISIAGPAGACYLLDGGGCETAAGTISPGSSVAVRLTTAASAGETVSATVTIAAVSAVFSATTAGDPGALSIALAAASLPDGEIGTAYAGFDFKPLASISDPGVSASDLAWSATGLPAGMLLGGVGVLVGAPSEAGVFAVAVTAAHASGASGARVYELVVMDPGGAMELVVE